MTTFYDVPAGILNPALAGKLSEIDGISRPQWADYVKTGIHRERPPTQENWWELRCAALLRKVGREGPIGVNSSHRLMAERRTMVPIHTLRQWVADTLSEPHCNNLAMLG